jgi:hypothetical protein
MRSRYGRPLPALIAVGSQTLSRADACLAAGDKLGALKDYATAYGILRDPHCKGDGAKEKKDRAAKAVAELLAELGPAPFGPMLCDHGVSRSFTCWCCQDAKLALADTVPPLAKTTPEPAHVAVETLYAGIGERSQIEKELSDAAKKGTG